MKKSAFLVALAILLCMSPGKAPVLSQPAAQAGGFTLRDMVGTNGLIPSPELNKQLKVGYVRVQVAWSEISPSRGTYKWERADGAIRQVADQGMGALADLTYTAVWASTNPNMPHSLWQAYPPQNVSDWTNFVDAAVTRYMASPYNVKYFQVWNEPTKAAGYWKGDSDLQWVDTIYIPAAKVIKSHGGNVVFGGWPQNGGLPGYNSELQYHNAWQYTDILDIHYYPIGQSFPPLYNQWIATGKCKGIWQTEIGAQNNPTLLNDQYSYLYTWARTKGNWHFADQYKLFWFTGFGASDNSALSRLPPGKATGQPVLTPNGQALAALAQKVQ